MNFDLHVHSDISDGTQPPAEVVASAKRAGLQGMALTDHDTTAGWGEAVRAAQEHQILVIPGMEITTRCGDCSWTSTPIRRSSSPSSIVHGCASSAAPEAAWADGTCGCCDGDMVSSWGSTGLWRTTQGHVIVRITDRSVGNLNATGGNPS